MNYELQNKIPQVRFPEFKEDWEEFRLSELITRVSENNKDEEFSVKEILSLSSTKGIVDRKELLGDTYDKVNHKNYIKTRLNDLVYGKSISSAYPYGLFKVNGCRDGLLSTLYFTFKVSDNTYPAYLDRYFSYHNRANNFLKKYVLVGDRYITADANYILSGKIFTPTLPEQKKIAHFFSTIDQKINQLQEKKKALEAYKKGVMQQVFSQKLRFKDDNGQDFPEWEVKKLGEVCDVRDGTHESPKYKNEGYPLLTSKNLLTNGQIDLKKVNLISKDDFDSINKRSEVSIGDILFGMIGTIGNPVILKENGFAIKNVALIKEKEELKNNFLIHYLKSNYILKQFHEQNTGGTQKFIALGVIRSLKIKIPTLQEQTKIANFLSKIDEKIENVNQQIAKTKEWKKGLLQKMFV